jgi:hypothetical protein
VRAPRQRQETRTFSSDTDAVHDNAKPLDVQHATLRAPIILPISEMGTFVVDLFWPLDWINGENGI